MSPEERDQLIQRYYDGETVGNEAAQAKAILESDPEARELIKELQCLSDNIKVEIQEAVAEEDFSSYWASIQSRLPDGPPTGEVETVPEEDSMPVPAVIAAEGRPDLVVGSPSTLAPPPRNWLSWLLGPAIGAAVATVLVLAVTQEDRGAAPAVPVAESQPIANPDDAAEPVQVVTAMRAMGAAPQVLADAGAHSIDIESVESEGPLVMVLQESAEEPAIIWFVETGDAT